MNTKTMESIALKTLKSMLTARGLVAEDFDSLGNPLDETKMYTFAGLLIIFSTKTRVSEKELNTFLTYAKENNHNSGILITSPSRPSESVLTILRNHITDRNNPLVQIFETRHLQFEISNHRYVPSHRILTNEESESVMKEFNVSVPRSFPKIDSQDPMAKWIGARPGDVIEVKGLCESSGENRRYRYCVPDVTNG